MSKLGLLITPSHAEVASFLPGIKLRNGHFPDAPAVGIEWPEGRLAVVVCGEGKARAAAYTALACERFQPDWVLMAGIAGVADTRQVGQWMVPDELLEGDYAPYGSGRERPMLRYDPSFFSRLLVSLEGLGHVVHGGRLVCADQDEIGAFERHDLEQVWHAKAIAWDSAGFVRGCMAAGKPYAELRVMLDLNGGMPHREVVDRLHALGDLSLENLMRRLLSGS